MVPPCPARPGTVAVFSTATASGPARGRAWPAARRRGSRSRRRPVTAVTPAFWSDQHRDLAARVVEPRHGVRSSRRRGCGRCRRVPQSVPQDALLTRTVWSSTVADVLFSQRRLRRSPRPPAASLQLRRAVASTPLQRRAVAAADVARGLVHHHLVRRERLLAMRKRSSSARWSGQRRQVAAQRACRGASRRPRGDDQRRRPVSAVVAGDRVGRPARDPRRVAERAGRGRAHGHLDR